MICRQRQATFSSKFQQSANCSSQGGVPLADCSNVHRTAAITIYIIFNITTTTIIIIIILCRVAEVARKRERPSPKSLDSDKKFKP